MSLNKRVRSAALVASLHFFASFLVAACVGGVVLGVWFPGSLREITSGVELFLIVIAVDVVCGPVLTFVLYNPSKSRKKWLLDLGLILLIQLSALAYGMSQLASARPVFVAFEGDRFRVVQALDVNANRLSEAPAELQRLSYSGPKVIGVRVAKSGEADHLASLQMSIQGLHPAFRPSRWRSYESQVPAVLVQLKPLSALRAKNHDKTELLDAALKRMDLNEDQLGYLPLVRDAVTDWVVLIDRSSGVPRTYLHLDGW